MQSMQMSLEMSTRYELLLEMRQVLQQRLEQQITMNATLEMYLEQEDFFNGLINWTNENNRWVRFCKEGFDFRYANVPRKLVSHVVEDYGCGFAHCQYNPFFGIARGEWTLFVVGDMMPKEFRDIIAIHERGEQLFAVHTDGEKICYGGHYYASNMEFAMAAIKKKTRKYISWIDRKYPNKFIDLAQKIHFPVLPQELLDELIINGNTNTGEILAAEQLMKKHQLPLSALKKMEEYGEISDQICEKLRGTIGQVQNRLYSLLPILEYHEPTKAAKLVNDMLVQTLRAIPEEDARVVSRAAARQELCRFAEIIGKEVYRITGRHLKMPYEFASAYTAAKRKELIVTAVQTAEDRTKEVLKFAG